MKVVRLSEVEKTSVGMEGASGAFKQMPLSTRDGVPNFSFRVFTLEPGGYTPFHSHPGEHLNYVIEGEGVLRDGEGVEREVIAGDFALVLPNEKHQYRNRSATKPFVMICAVPREYE